MLLRVHLIHALQVTQKSLKEKLGLIRSHCLFLVLFSLLQEVDQKDLASFFCQKVFCLFSEFYCTGLTSRPLINVKTCHSVVSDSSRPQGLLPTRLLCPWNCSGKTIGVGCHSLLQGIFLTRDQTWFSCIAGRFFTIWVTREADKLISVGNNKCDVLKSF